LFVSHDSLRVIREGIDVARRSDDWGVVFFMSTSKYGSRRGIRCEMGALGERLNPRCLDCGQPITQHGGRDFDHLAAESLDPASLRRTRSSAVGNTQSLNGAPLKNANARSCASNTISCVSRG
jgi:hypothetical protein